MNAEIICIVAEHLPEEHTGYLTAYISKKLFELGHRTTFETVCQPEKAEIEARLSSALKRSDLVIMLGGIEPETNSVAKTALSSVTGIPLVASEEALQSVKSYCQSINTEPTPEQMTAAIVLKGAAVFKNELGLSVGQSVKTDSSTVLLLPYAEGELTHMFDTLVAPTLSPYGISAVHTVNVIGLDESSIESMLARLSGRSEYAINIEKHGAEHTVRVSAVADTYEKAEAVSLKAVASVKFALGKSAYAVDSKGIQFEVVARLREKGLTVSTAESCTAGMVSEMLTDVGGSSEVFEYGISAYSNRIKTEILKVSEKTIEEYSAISFETAKEMAINVRALSGASLGIGITGNAGPSPSENKPVGLVYVSLADENNYIVKELKLSPELLRDEIRTIAATTALDLVRCYLLSYPDGMAGMMKYTPNNNLNSVAKPITEAPSVPSTAKDESSEVTSSDTIYSLIFDRETDEDYYDEAMAKEYKFTKRFDISEKLENIKDKISGFFGGILPMKSDSKKKRLLKIGFLVCLAVFIASASVLWVRLTDDKEQRDILVQAQTEFYSNLTPENNNNTAAFQPFYEANEDLRGWITIGGTEVDNPIYQTTDNDYYLTHNMYKEKSRYGALFYDYRCDLSDENSSQNLTIYGHEMKDGSMFGTLKRYKSLSQYKQNPTFTITTENRVDIYKIFSVMVVNAKPEDDNGYLFNYTTPYFSSQKAFLEWVDEAVERSIITTNVEVSANDKVVTLVTCINDFEDARFVIMAKLAEDGEDTTVPVSSAALNPNPRYPKAWYDKRGLEGYVDPNSSSEETVSQDASSEILSSETTSNSSSNDIATDGSSSDGESSEESSSDNASSEPISSQAVSVEPVSSEDISSEEVSSEVSSAVENPESSLPASSAEEALSSEDGSENNSTI